MEAYSQNGYRNVFARGGDPEACEVGNCGMGERLKFATRFEFLEARRKCLGVFRGAHHPGDAVLAEKSAPLFRCLEAGRIHGPTGRRVAIEERHVQIIKVPQENERVSVRFVSLEGRINESSLLVARRLTKQIPFS